VQVSTSFVVAFEIGLTYCDRFWSRPMMRRACIGHSAQGEYTGSDIYLIGYPLALILTLARHPSMYTTHCTRLHANRTSVIAMQRMKIPVLPSIINAALITTIVSAGNAYTFNASRSLHALALEGQAPAFLRRTNSK
jgi:amino acid transporter